ncbi:unnamed protein product [Cylicostephanus goldi]|uniref:Uncharacterized protein n=1 Tax=Cylicostephanus goldi TaxID=71465 RepID=A0A3P6RKA1_CYLGO|nr:unnamed protein product [Cylicostephanus goldi]
MFEYDTTLLDNVNERRKLKHSLIATSSLSRLALQRHEKDIKALKVIHSRLNSSKSKKPNTERQKSRHVGKAFAVIISGVFALINFVFAFYNLSRVAIGVACTKAERNDDEDQPCGESTKRTAITIEPYA